MLKVKKKDPDTTRESTLVLSRADMTRIKNHLEPIGDERQERSRMDNEERQRLHEMSVNQVKSWTNTVLGQRQANLERRKMKEEMEEQHRKKIDLEEAKLQAEKRRQIIEHAKMQQYFETERIRKFHSALLLSETLHEREKQIEYKNFLRQTQMDREKTEVQEYIWSPGDGDRMMERQIRRKEISDFQKNQIENKRYAKERESEELKNEEEKELSIAIETFKDEQEKALIKRKTKISLGRENYARHLELKKKMDDEEMKRREKENEVCREFSIKKINFSKMVAQKEIEIIKQKQEQSAKMAEIFSWPEKQPISHEDDDVQKYLHEEDRRMAKRQQEEDEKKAKMKESLRKNYQEQEENKKKMRENKLKEKADAIEAEAKVLDEQKKKEEATRIRKLSEDKHLKEHHLQSIAEKSTQTERERKEKMEEEQQRKCLADEDDKKFIDYSSDVIKQLELQGRNTNMLRKVTAKVIDRHHPGPQE